jgi:two-component system, chemotaxis family, protein-glutamate methylesterase/glutaminase
MLVRRKAGSVQIGLSDAEPEHSCRPAVDVLFRSVADVYGASSLCIIMTGMGNDGALGMQRLKQTGAYCLTQTAESCVIYGMPRAADEMGLPDEHVSLENLPDRIAQLVYAGRKERV